MCATFCSMRVIAGALGSRRLQVPPKGVRPTSDRVREAMFAALGDLSDSRVLDLFAGSGALGVEALSRGASQAIFVERARSSLTVLKANLESLGLGDVSEVLAMDALRALPVLAGRGLCFDLVLLDPPYAADLIGPVLSALQALELVAPEGLVVVERAKRNSLGPIDGWLRDREREYGQTVVTHLRPDPDPGAPDVTMEAEAKRDGN